MDEKHLFGLALDLTSPWFIEKVSFDPGQKRIDLSWISSADRRFRARNAEAAKVAPFTTQPRRYRDIWTSSSIRRHCTDRTGSRIECPTHGVRLTNMPWSRPCSGFTLFFGALALLMCQQMPVAGGAKVMLANANRMWWALKHYVVQAVENPDYGDVRDVGADEYAQRKGHDYITTFCDLEQSRGAFEVEDGRKCTVKRFGTFLDRRGILRDRFRIFYSDMWEPYRPGITEEFPAASLTFDRFRILTMFNRVIDQVRRKEVLSIPFVKNSRLLWLRSQREMTGNQRLSLAWLSRLVTRTRKAYQIKLPLQRL